MFFEIFIIALFTLGAALKFSSFLCGRCSFEHQINEGQCASTIVPPNAVPSSHKAKSKRKRSKKSKQLPASFSDQHEEKEASDLKASPIKSLRNRNVSSRESTHVPVTVHQRRDVAVSEPVSTLKMDQKARNRMLFLTQNATGPFTFTLDEHGGWVKTPFCKLLFLHRAVFKPILITVTPKYQWKRDEDGHKVLMTPEIYFTSKDEMKFKRPVEVQLQTHYSATKKKEPISVEIERIEHCVSSNWLKIDEVKFSKGMIKFFVIQFCGIRAVCDSCQKSIMSRRVSYSVSVKENPGTVEAIKNFYLRIFTDTPDLHWEVESEMENDGYRRIHPSQKYSVRYGCKIMVRLTSKNLESVPSFEIVETDDDIIFEAILFQLKSGDGSPITTSDLPVSSQIAEISPFKSIRMLYSKEDPNTVPKRANFTFYGGSGIQANVNVGHVSQETVNLAPSVPTQPQISSLLQQPTLSQAAPTVQIHSATSETGCKAFEVTPVEETAPKSPIEIPHAKLVNLGPSVPVVCQKQFSQLMPSPIPYANNCGEPAFISQLDRSLWNRPQCSSRLSSSSLPPCCNDQYPNSPGTSDSHPTYTQTVGRHQFHNRRSAFSLLARNSSHPSLASLDNLLPLNFQPVSANVSDSNLSAVVEEYRNQNFGFSDEVSEALLPNENLSAQENQSKVDRGIQVRRPLIPEEHPSTVSSGFESGLSTRETSSTDFEPGTFLPIDYAKEELQFPETEDSITIRPRSISCSTETRTKLLASSSLGYPDKSVNAGQSVQIKSYSSAVKTENGVPLASTMAVKAPDAGRSNSGKGNWRQMRRWKY